jgi:two-component system cell cycle response regulator
MGSSPRIGTSDSAGGETDLAEEDEVTAVGLRAPSQAAREESRACRHPQLIVLMGESVGKTFSLERPAIIGRGDVAQVRLHDDGISRRHAMIVRVSGDLCLEDLQSANGTRVNGQPITRHVLRDGDKIQLGEKTILKFADADSVEEGFHQAMYEAAVRDALTRVYNRRHFVERLASEVAYSRRHRSPLSLLMIDIDHFKHINDGHGHPAGDHVLAALGQILLAAVRAEDIVARYGGEEFAILCRGTPPMSALQLAERLRRAVESHAFVYRDKRISVTLSVGIAMCADSPTAAQQLVAKADAALYEAKQTGRNRAVLQHPTEAQ